MLFCNSVYSGVASCSNHALGGHSPIPGSLIAFSCPVSGVSVNLEHFLSFPSLFVSLTFGRIRDSIQAVWGRNTAHVMLCPQSSTLSGRTGCQLSCRGEVHFHRLVKVACTDDHFPFVTEKSPMGDALTVVSNFHPVILL